MRLFGVKLLTSGGLACLNRAALNDVQSAPAESPLRAEGKEFLLTQCGQSVINIFTAFGFRVQFCIRFL
jgi:hypothetical protein